jgi:hypothetical protein
MSAALMLLPQSRRGRRSADQERAYQLELDEFAAAILKIKSRLEFTVSSRGWCYILEEHGLQKGEFDRAQRLINDCRKTGRLPIGICKEDDARQLHGLVDDDPDEDDAGHYALRCLASAESQIESAYRDARDVCRGYTPIGWNDGLDHTVVVLVEKVDLVSLFTSTCRRYRVPIANAKGWSDLHLRAASMEYFRDGEEEGRRPALLYCGDHDPAGLLISQTLPKQFADLSRAVGWSPDEMIVDRFGLNADFIEQHGLSWIGNLETGSGGSLADPDHSSHDRGYVQEYIRKFGIRKVEANALVTRPAAGRQLIEEAITRYIPRDWPEQHAMRNAAPRTAALAEFDLLVSQS